MAGHMGDRNTTVQNLEIEKIDVDENVLLVKGAVPGSIGSFVKVTPSIKDGAKLSLEPIVEEASDTATETEEVVENITEVATPEAPKEESQNTEAKETVDADADADAGTEDIKEETKEAEAAPADDTPKEETNVAEEQNKTKKEDEKE
jgi:hypothetical protein